MMTPFVGIMQKFHPLCWLPNFRCPYKNFFQNFRVYHALHFTVTLIRNSYMHPVYGSTYVTLRSKINHVRIFTSLSYTSMHRRTYLALSSTTRFIGRAVDPVYLKIYWILLLIPTISKTKKNILIPWRPTNALTNNAKGDISLG